jgi:PhnB protein
VVGRAPRWRRAATAETLVNVKIEPYLFFNGRCEEAIAFYREAIGAETQAVMRMNEAPEAPPAGMMPPGWERKVMHANLRVGGTHLMMSDGMSADPARFDGFSLSLSAPDTAQAERWFQALAAGGEVRMPLGKTFFSPCFGMLADRFGVGWMVGVFED